MGGFENDVLLAKNVNFDIGAAKPHVGIMQTGGQLLIATGNDSPLPEIEAGNIVSPNLTIDVQYNALTGNIEIDTGAQAALTITTDSGDASPIANVLFMNGAGGTSVTADGMNHITITGGGGGGSTNLIPDTGTSPVTPDANQITITGSLVAAGTHPIRTDGTGAHTLAIEVQKSQALVAADATKVGMANFYNSQFAVDPNGFVTLVGGAGAPVLTLDVDANTAPGTDPVNPNGSGSIILTGGQVATGTIGSNVIRTNSLALNTATIEIQRSTTASSADSSKNGVSHFDSTYFSVDGTGFVSAIRPNSTIILKDDFVSFVNSGNLISELLWQTSSAFLAGSLNSIDASTHPGVLSNGATSSPNRTFLATNGGGVSGFVRLGGGAITLNWVFKVSTLSDGTNTYKIELGLGSVTTVSAQVNGCYFTYTNAVNSGNWVINCANSSVTTSTNSSVPVTTGWHNAQININAAGTSVEFFMDGVSLGTINTNIPTDNIFPLISFLRSAGTIPADTLAIDLFYYLQKLTTAR